MESNADRSDSAVPIAPAEAASAMAAIAASRSWLADRIIAPCWYHPAFGLVTGAAIAEAEARNWALVAWSIVAYTVACGALAWFNQRRVGVAMRYFDAGTSTVFALQVLALAALIALACWVDLVQGVRGGFLAAGALAVPVTVAFGRWTDRLLRARLRAGR
jgi:hypothetical protein